MRPSTLATLTAVATAALMIVPADAGASRVPPLDDVRLAKIGLAEFLAEHVDRPLRITESCPSLSVESANWYLANLGLTPSAGAYGVAVVFADDLGGGVAALRCGNDLSRAADPAGSVSLSVDVAMLDGQATFDQYAVDLDGDDAEITAIAEPPGVLAGRCTNGGRDCTVAFNVEGLVVTVRVKGLPAEIGEQLAQQLVVAVTPEIVTNLAAIALTDD